MEDNKKNLLEQVKAESDEALASFRQVVDDELERIAGFTEDNAEELMQMILEDLRDLYEIQESALILASRINANDELKEHLTYQRGLTKKDIIDENIIRIYLIYNAVVAATWITSSDVLIFIKNFLITSLTLTISFLINLRYFTSDYRKRQIDEKIKEITESRAVNLADIATFNKFCEMYVEELRAATRKFYDIAHNDEAKFAKFLNMLEKLKVKYVIGEETGKKKIRKK